VHLTLFTDYALRSLLYLTWHAGRPCTVDEVAGYFRISADHVTKVMQHLARQGYVRSRRGRRGGAVLARAAEEIRLGDWIVERTCPHRHADLAVFGEVDGCELVCTLHGWRFDLDSGKCLTAENRNLKVRRAQS